MDVVIEKLNQWFVLENDILAKLAHEVALAKTVEEMVKAKNVYEVQATKVNVIIEALRLVVEQK